MVPLVGTAMMAPGHGFLAPRELLHHRGLRGSAVVGRMWQIR